MKAETIRQRLNEQFDREISQYVAEQGAQVTEYLLFVMDTHKLWSEENTYTFPDGFTLDRADLGE